MSGRVDPSTEAIGELLGDWSNGAGHRYERLAAAVRAAVSSGVLPPGSPMPSERRLAELLAISRTTVGAAYDDLRADGILQSRRGSGTRIHPLLRRPPADGGVPGSRARPMFQRLIDGRDTTISLAHSAEPGGPELAAAIRAVASADLDDLLAEPLYLPAGLPACRAAIAEHLTGRGLTTAPDEVLVTTGAQQAVSLAADLYVSAGDLVLTETPSAPSRFDVFRAAGARLLGVPLDSDGLDAHRLAARLSEHDPALLFVMPTFHNPTGTLMSDERRRRIAALAGRAGVPVLEDDSYRGTWNRTGEAPPPLAAYAAPDHEVLVVGSLSKLTWSGLRVGWIRAPAPIVDRLARRKVLADLGGSLFDQAVAARLLPDLDGLASGRAALLAERLALLERLLRSQLPSWRWRHPDGGPALWVGLPGVDAEIYAQVARRHGVEVIPGSTMDPAGAASSQIRVPFTHPPDTLEHLVERLHRAWSEVTRHGPLDAKANRHVIG